MATADLNAPDGRTVLLRHMRLSFAESLLDKKATVEDGTPKHSFNTILEAGDKYEAENKGKIAGALKAAAEKEWKNEGMVKIIAEDDPKRVCYRSGSKFKNKETQQIYAGYEGNMAIACGTPGGGQRRPQKMFDRHKRLVEISDIPTVFYNGTYVDVILSFYGTKKGGNGIFCTCESIRSHQEGEPMGSAVAVSADMFDELEDDAFGAATGGGADADDLGIG